MGQTGLMTWMYLFGKPLDSVLTASAIKRVTIFPILILILGGSVYVVLAAENKSPARSEPTGNEKSAADAQVPVANVRAFGAKGNGLADDTEAIQSAVDYAITGKLARVFFPQGKYRITDTVKVGYGDNTRISVSLEGLPSFLGHAEIIADFTDRPAINIQGGVGVRVKGLRVTGKNIAPEKVAKNIVTANTIATSVNGWISPGCSNKQHSPYAGIAVDAYSGKPPGDAYPNDPYNRVHSSAIVIEDVTIMHFVVGVAVKPSDNDNNAENIKIQDSIIMYNTFAVSVGGAQQRNVALENVGIAGSYVAITTFRHGRQKGQFPLVYNSTFGLSFRLFEARGDLGVVNIDKVDAESFAEIGIFGKGISSIVSPATVSNSNLYIYRFDNYKSSRNVSTFTNLKFSSCNFYTHEGLFNVAADGGGIVTLENSSFADLTEASDRFINSQLHNEHRLNVDRSFLSFDPPSKVISDVYKTDVVPKRLSISTNTYEIVEFDTGKRFRIDKPSHYVSVPVTNIALGTGTVSFRTSYQAKFRIGDYLYWQTDYTPLKTSSNYLGLLRRFVSGFFWPDQGLTSKYAWLLPVLQVSAISGSKITSKMLATDIDKSYTPPSINILRTNFVNKVAATGDLNKGSNQITNVSYLDNFKVGDWIFGSGVPKDARIRSINKLNNSIGISYVARVNAAKVKIYNSLLREIQ